MIRRQLPAYAPLSLAKLLGAALHAASAPSRGAVALERLLAERFGADRVLLTSSGTHALQTALSLASATPPWAERPVALPAYTCYDVATAAVGAGVEVLFYDIDPDTLSPDADGVRRALSEGAGMLVASNLYGFPIDWSWLRRECEDNGALLLEDAAQGLGSGWAGEEGGRFGDVTVLSFGRGKGWTGGGGGALLLRRGRLAEAGDRGQPAALGRSGVVTDLRSLALSLAQWGFGRPSLFRLPSSIPLLALGETRYREPTPPTRMGAFPAAAAVAHADMAIAEAESRRTLGERWRALLEADDAPLRDAYRIPRPLEGGACGYLRFPMLTGRSGPPAAALLGRGSALGLAGGYPRALPSLPALRGFLPERGHEAPGAADLARRLFTLPTHSRVHEQDLLNVVDLLRATAGRVPAQRP